MKVHISDEERKILNSVFKEYQDQFEILVFGSRSRGDHKKYSDLDICLKGKDKINSSVITELKNIFQESNLPYTVDIVDWNNISKEFQVNIKDDLMPLNLLTI